MLTTTPVMDDAAGQGCPFILGDIMALTDEEYRVAVGALRRWPAERTLMRNYRCSIPPEEVDGPSRDFALEYG